MPAGGEEHHRSYTGASAGLLRSAAHQTDCRPSASIRQPASAQRGGGVREREGEERTHGARSPPAGAPIRRNAQGETRLKDWTCLIYV